MRKSILKKCSNKKILLLFCGGTIVMEEKNGVLCPPDDKNKAIKLLENIEPKLSKIFPYDLKFVENIDSTNINPNHWKKILNVIGKNYENYDGFVITHGTDTMAYTASALSVAIEGLGKPIVLTGSQISACELESDARRNLVNAFRIATMDLAGVFIVFDERIILGNRATKASESMLDAFRSVGGEDAGEIRVDIRIKDFVPKRRKEKHKIKIFPEFESDIFVYTLTPGCDLSDLIFLLENERIKGIIIRAFGTGNIPEKGVGDFLGRAKEKKVPVVVMSQCLYGRTEMHIYEVGKNALKLGAIQGFDQSLELISIKLMWALKNQKNRIKDFIENTKGE